MRVFEQTQKTVTAQSASRSVVGLDIMRLVAASLVVIYHFFFWQLVADPTYAGLASAQQLQAFSPFAHFGWVGVEIFFLISGYVIAFSAQGADAYSFARSRFLRIVPAVWIAAPLTFALYYCVMGKPIAELVPQFLRTVAFFPLYPALDGVYWTLGIEISFYLLIWALIYFNKRNWIAHLPASFCVIGLGFWLFFFAGILTINSSDIRVLFYKAIAFRPFQLLLIQHGAFFGLGIFMKNFDAKKLGVRNIAIFLGLVLTCSLEILAQNGIIERSAQLELPAWPALAVFLVALILCTGLIAFNRQIVTSLPSMVPVTRRIGLMTYPLYLLHNPIGLSVALMCQPLIGLIPALSLGIVVAFISAFLVSKTFEPAVRSRLATLLQHLMQALDRRHTPRVR